MKGYYVIPSNGEPIEVTGKNARGRAINKAIAIYNERNDDEVFVHQFDDDNSDGYSCDFEILTLSEMLF